MAKMKVWEGVLHLNHPKYQRDPRNHKFLVKDSRIFVQDLHIFKSLDSDDFERVMVWPTGFLRAIFSFSFRFFHGPLTCDVRSTVG